MMDSYFVEFLRDNLPINEYYILRLKKGVSL